MPKFEAFYKTVDRSIKLNSKRLFAQQLYRACRWQISWSYFTSLGKQKFEEVSSVQNLWQPYVNLRRINKWRSRQFIAELHSSLTTIFPNHAGYSNNNFDMGDLWSMLDMSHINLVGLLHNNTEFSYISNLFGLHSKSKANPLNWQMQLIYLYLFCVDKW